jgi:hypothetical protein
MRLPSGPGHFALRTVHPDDLTAVAPRPQIVVTPVVGA